MPQATFHLNISDPMTLAAFQELFQQTNIHGDFQTIWDGVESEGMESPLSAINLSALPRPFRFNDVLALVNNLPYTRILTFSHFELDIRNRKLTDMRTETAHRLTGKECDLLRFFHQNRGIETPKERILKEIWEYHPEVATHTLETHIYRLRQKLEDNPAVPTLLLNGEEGYVFNIDS